MLISTKNRHKKNVKVSNNTYLQPFCSTKRLA